MTNCVLLQRLDLFDQAKNEFCDIAQGTRQDFSREVRKVSWLPAVTLGLYTDAWDMAEQAVACSLGVSPDRVSEAWASLAREMARHGEAALAHGLFDEDFVLEVPPELVIGLPARAFLDTVKRSPAKSLVLATGLEIKEPHRPRGRLADAVWTQLMAAQQAYASCRLRPDQEACLEATCLAGGGGATELPAALAALVEKAEELPAAARQVRGCCVAAAVECSWERMFRSKLEEVVTSVLDTPSDDDYVAVPDA